VKSGTCPKCHSESVFSGAEIPLKQGPFASNAIPISLTLMAAMDNYVCTQCGYVESYISDKTKLEAIGNKWRKITGEASAAPDKA
jgi:predicted nucleic-acid-binding Zn-ribbon protein